MYLHFGPQSLGLDAYAILKLPSTLVEPAKPNVKSLKDRALEVLATSIATQPQKVKELGQPLSRSKKKSHLTKASY